MRKFYFGLFLLAAGCVRVVVPDIHIPEPHPHWEDPHHHDDPDHHHFRNTEVIKENWNELLPPTKENVEVTVPVERANVFIPVETTTELPVVETPTPVAPPVALGQPTETVSLAAPPEQPKAGIEAKLPVPAPVPVLKVAPAPPPYTKIKHPTTVIVLSMTGCGPCAKLKQAIGPNGDDDIAPIYMVDKLTEEAAWFIKNFPDVGYPIIQVRVGDKYYLTFGVITKEGVKKFIEECKAGKIKTK